MSSNNRRSSSSSGERQRIKSRSPSRSHRASPNKNLLENNEKSRRSASRRTTQEKSPKKRSQSSHSISSANAASPKSNKSAKQKSKTKTPSPSNRKGISKRKKSEISASDNENKQSSEENNAEKQDISFRGLSIVPQEIVDLITLRRLNISNNNLSGLPPGIRSLVHLEYLDISRNPLRVKNGHDDYSCLPKEFRYLKNLQTLILAECTLKHIPVVVWHTVSLQTLDISRNKVGFIVGEIGNLISIRHLRFSQMNLDTIPPEIGFCDKLETMDLTGNPVDNLPETLVECRQLHELKLNYKTFHRILDNYMLELIDEGKIRSEHIPHVVFELENLRILDLNETKLNTIPTQHTLFNLRELYLSSNSFLQIPESICTMKNLKLLDMSANFLETIPEYLTNVENLETLILSYNNLTILPCVITRSLTLKNLIINNNKIMTIESGFSDGNLLISLDLSYNQIETIPIELCNLKQLETLDLRYNAIKYLPLEFRHLVGLKAMNKFDENFQRFGLHLLGNKLVDPPSFVWKSTSIHTLFDYLEKKEKFLGKNFYHLKLILIGPKNIGKTSLASKLLHNYKTITNKRKTLDTYVTNLEQNQLKDDQITNQQEYSDHESSILTDQWIENRVSTTTDYFLNRATKIKRTCPPPLKSYEFNENSEIFFNKSTFITKNNLYCTIFDTTSQPNFEILYPLLYDSNSLFIIPINLTILLKIIQVATSLENINEDVNHVPMIDYDALLTKDWLYCHIFRYIESISDHCQHASIAIIGLILHHKIEFNEQQQNILDEIHSKVNMFLTDEENQRKNIKIYSEIFPHPFYLDDYDMSQDFIKKLETIGQQWNIKHNKEKCKILKQMLGLIGRETLTIDYEVCLENFNEQKNLSNIVTDNENINEDEKENNDLLKNEINQMTFDECLDYLQITGDIICFGQNNQPTILIKPYYFLNNILSRTVFRSHIDQWLNYDENVIFHFSGYYRTLESFNIDRERLFNYGEYTWKMLNVLFMGQSNDKTNISEEKLLDYCYLMEKLYLGFVNEPNLNHREFSSPSFICPWFINEKAIDMNPINYFRLLEQTRYRDQLQCDRARKIKQQNLWFALDNLQGSYQLGNTNSYSQQEVEIQFDELPTVEQIDVPDKKIINKKSLETIKICKSNVQSLPNGFYEKLLICLHGLFYERLDYSNMTIGRTIDRNLIKIERSIYQIQITTNHVLISNIQNILLDELFSIYPTINFRIET